MSSPSFSSESSSPLLISQRKSTLQSTTPHIIPKKVIPFQAIRLQSYITSTDNTKTTLTQEALLRINTAFTTPDFAFFKFDLLTTRFQSNTYIELCNKKQEIIQHITKTDTPSPHHEHTPHHATHHHHPPHDDTTMAESLSLYGTSLPISPSIHKNKYLFVFEMNNTIDKIMGIGLIKNILYADKDRITIYHDDERHNQYIYKSNYHIPLIMTSSPCLTSLHQSQRVQKKKSKERNGVRYHDNIPDEYIDFIQTEIEPACFYGKGHLKRGGGFTRLPAKLLTLRVLKKVLKLFAIVNPNHFNENILLKRF